MLEVVAKVLLILILAVVLPAYLYILVKAMSAGREAGRLRYLDWWRQTKKESKQHAEKRGEDETS